MGEIFIFETRAVGGSVTDHPVVYLCLKQSEFPVVLYSHLMRKAKLKINKGENVKNTSG